MSIWRNLVARWGSGAGEVDEVRIDGSTNALQCIDYEHHEIHSGSHFYVAGFNTLDDTETVIVGITTPDTTEWTHLVWKIVGTSQTEFYIYEDSTITGGVSATPLNNNRNSGHTSSLTAVIAPTVNTNGTLIFSQSAGKAGATPAKADISDASARSKEIILKQDTIYTIQIVSGGDGNIVSYDIEWYEHTDKH